MINMNKGVKRIVLSAIFFLCVLAMLLCGTMGNDYFVLALAHGANAETTVEGDTLDKEMSSDERVFVSTKEVCEGFVCAFFVL